MKKRERETAHTVQPLFTVVDIRRNRAKILYKFDMRFAQRARRINEKRFRYPREMWYQWVTGMRLHQTHRDAVMKWPHTHMQFKCWNWPMFKYTRNNNMNYSIKNAHISINCFQFWFYWILSHFSHYRSWAKWIVTIPFLFRLVTKHNNLLIANQHLMIINRARTIKIVCGPCMVRSDTRYDQHEKKWFGLILTIEMEWRDSIAENGWRGQNSWMNEKKKTSFDQRVIGQL